MADSADSTLNLLIKLGIIGLQEVQSAQQLLLETVRATHGMGDANTTLSRDAEIAIAAAKEHGLNAERASMGTLVTNLHLGELISTELLHNVMVLSETLNRAVHGEKITSEEARHSLETGKVVLKKLES